MTTGKTLRGAVLALALGLAFGLGGCGAGDESMSGGASGVMADDASVSARDGAKGAGSSSSTSGSAVDVASTVTGTQQIRTARVRLTVEHVDEAATRVRELATGLGGLVQKEDTVTEPGEEGDSSEITVRVPADRLDTAIGQLDSLGRRDEMSSTSKDVTTQVADLDSRVASQEKSVERLRALLDEATSVKDVIAIESELATRQADLESLQAQARAVADKVALSTLVVRLDPPGAVEDEADAGFLTGLGAGWTALRTGVTVLLTVIGALLPLAAGLAVVAVPVWFAYRRFRVRNP
ncbi:DUF4349 domain-containing protein [Kineosporia sp. J2-2]|uniref:DUF4349 domain-containing protein n=1 Tax=Kineosporia corallincola TaxID=2835133 RepID=A0ABS5TG59_9ACTN|nr:DUF4349 domain-containing protein [Kineosporia corallincola]MBT0769181.1 DUF4349 domain-containing protein [Kineosporia corallincola]